VQATSLDAFFEAKGWPRVDLVKMDVEGQELKTLRGMRALVARNPHMGIVFEYNLGQIKRNRIDRHELFASLQSLGFRRFSVLFRGQTKLDLPAELERLDRLARRANVIVFALP
jgi:hypothetical protein